MKKLLLISLIALVGCHKENPSPSTPVVPVNNAPGANYVIINGDSHTNDTIRFHDYLICMPYMVDSMAVRALDTTIIGRQVFIHTYPIHTGVNHVSFTQDVYNASFVRVDAASTYNRAEMDVVFTRADGIGGLVEGTYSGTMKNQITNMTINISGIFSVVRQ